MTAVPSPTSIPAVSTVPVKPRRRAWVSATFFALKLAYALSAGAFAVWIVSFTPSPGPELTQFVPARAGVVIHIHHGATLLTDLTQNPAFQELLNDPDFSRLFAQLKQQRANTAESAAAQEPASDGAMGANVSSISEQIRHDYENSLSRAPKFVRNRLQRMFPPEIESLFPLVGQEFIFARVVPELDPEQVAAKHKSNPQALLITRVSGGPGILARMLCRFSKNPRARLYDLGGDAIAVGINGAAPGTGRPSPLEPGLSSAGAPAVPQGEPLARITVFPPILEGKFTPQSDLSQTPLGPYLQALAESVVKSLLRAPTVSDMLGLSETPREIRIDVFETSGGIVARGEIDGGVPALPANIPDPTTAQRISADNTARAAPYLEGVLPINTQAIYLFSVANELRNEKEKDATAAPLPQDNVADFTHRPRGMTKSQWNCLRHIAFLQDREVDLDRDLFPMCGKALHFRMDDPPPDLSPTGYGLLRAAMSFNGTNETARDAMRDLTHSGWDMFVDAPGKGAHTPYVRFFPAGDHDCYVLATGEIFAPSWRVAPTSLSLTSDAGSFALMRNGPQILPPPSILPPAPTTYFLKLDGRRIAPSVETFQSNRYSDLEKDLGSQAFLAKYPDAELHSTLTRKLCGLLGKLSLEITPLGSGKGLLKLDWKPGSVNVPSVKREPSTHGDSPKENAPPPPAPDDAPAPPPPPAPDDTPAPPPPPPPDDK